MRNTLLIIFLLLVGYYLSASFCSLELNPLKWTEPTRFGVSVISMVTLILVVGERHGKKLKNE